MEIDIHKDQASEYSTVLSATLRRVTLTSVTVALVALMAFGYLEISAPHGAYGAIISPVTTSAPSSGGPGPTTTAFGPSGYPGTTSSTVVNTTTFGTTPSTVPTTIVGITSTTIVGVSTTVVAGSTTSAPNNLQTKLIKLPTYYSAVTEEGAKVCNYQPNATLTTTLDGQTGPTLTTDSTGCITAAVTYYGNSNFQLNGSQNYTLSQGQNNIVLTGPAASGGQLATTIQFDLAAQGKSGNASALKSKGVPLLSLAIIAGLLLDAILFASGLALHMASKRAKAGSELPVAGDDDDEEEEEEGEFSGDDFFGESEPSGEIPAPR